MLKLLAAVALSCLPSITQAEQSTATQVLPLEERIAAANSAFDAGDYKQALHHYRALLHDGHINGHVFYNMGIANYRLQQRGQAMSAFLAARHYLPRDADVAFNLRYLQDSLEDGLIAVIKRKFYEIVSYINAYFTEREISMVTLSLFALALIFLAIFMLRKQIVFLLKLGILLLILAILSAILWQAKSRFAKHWGAVTTAAATVRSGASASSLQLYELHAGAPFLIAGRTNDYFKIRLSDGKKGWVRMQDVRSMTYDIAHARL